jgi:hypothetical protein
VREAKETSPSYEPFVLRTVVRSGLTCSRCHWRERCAGCTLVPEDTYCPDLWTSPFLAIDWHPALLEDHYNPTANELIEHTSVAGL